MAFLLSSSRYVTYFPRAIHHVIDGTTARISENTCYYINVIKDERSALSDTTTLPFHSHPRMPEQDVVFAQQEMIERNEYEEERDDRLRLAMETIFDQSQGSTCEHLQMMLGGDGG